MPRAERRQRVTVSGLVLVIIGRIDVGSKSDDRISFFDSTSTLFTRVSPQRGRSIGAHLQIFAVVCSVAPSPIVVRSLSVSGSMNGHK